MKENEVQTIITRLTNNDTTLTELNLVFNYTHDEIKEIIKAIRNNYTLKGLQLRIISKELIKSLLFNHTLINLYSVEYTGCYREYAMMKDFADINSNLSKQDSKLRKKMEIIAMAITKFYGTSLPFQLIGAYNHFCNNSILNFYLIGYKNTIRFKRKR